MNPWKLATAIIISLYYAYYLNADPSHTYATWNIIDSLDLVIHEAGHFIFMFFGQFMHVLGGSLTQILLPVIFVGYFFLRREYFSASLLLFWVGQNIINVSIYLGDSVLQQLPLLGGDGVMHDWNYLLSTTGLLGQTNVLFHMSYGIGVLTLICAGASSVWFSLGATAQGKVRAILTS
ncbi:MAG: hypothetical protein V4524_00650 [Patescibacteria group bacterium]